MNVHLSNGICVIGHRLSCQLKMVYTASEYMARFTIWSHMYIQTSQTSQIMYNFIVFQILLKQQQYSLTPI
jgi:hypothetical protein